MVTFCIRITSDCYFLRLIAVENAILPKCLILNLQVSALHIRNIVKKARYQMGWVLKMFEIS